MFLENGDIRRCASLADIVRARVDVSVLDVIADLAFEIKLHLEWDGRQAHTAEDEDTHAHESSSDRDEAMTILAVFAHRSAK